MKISVISYNEVRGVDGRALPATSCADGLGDAVGKAAAMVVRAIRQDVPTVDVSGR